MFVSVPLSFYGAVYTSVKIIHCVISEFISDSFSVFQFISDSCRVLHTAVLSAKVLQLLYLLSELFAAFYSVAPKYIYALISSTVLLSTHKMCVHFRVLSLPTAVVSTSLRRVTTDGDRFNIPLFVLWLLVMSLLPPL